MQLSCQNYSLKEEEGRGKKRTKPYESSMDSGALRTFLTERQQYLFNFKMKDILKAEYKLCILQHSSAHSFTMFPVNKGKIKVRGKRLYSGVFRKPQSC